MTEETQDRERIRQREVLTKVLRLVTERRMTAPALFVLESTKPLSFLASQALIFFEPIVRVMLPLKDYGTFAQAIEDRDNIEWMIQQLEAAEEAHAAASGVRAQARTSPGQAQARVLVAHQRHAGPALRRRDARVRRTGHRHQGGGRDGGLLSGLGQGDLHGAQRLGLGQRGGHPARQGRGGLVRVSGLRGGR